MDLDFEYGFAMPDGSTDEALARAHAAQLWDVETGKQTRLFPLGTDSDPNFALSKDGTKLLYGYESALVQVSIEDGIQRDFNRDGNRSSTTMFKGINAIALSPDGRLAALGSRVDYSPIKYVVQLWDLESDDEHGRLEGHTSEIYSVAFSPDGKRIVSGSGESSDSSVPEDFSLRLWDVNSFSEVRRFIGHTSLVTSLAFDIGGTFLCSGSADGTVRVWDIESGKEVNRFKHGRPVSHVAMSPDGAIVASGGADQVIRLWRVR